MLKIFREFRGIEFGKLMGVYAQSNQENAEVFYPGEEPGAAVLRAEQDFLTYLREAFFCTDGAFYAVWEEDGTYISALRLEPYKDGLLLEALETAPQHRQKGYAAALLKSVLTYLEALGGSSVYSHVGKRNIASLKTHDTCGFQRILEHAVYIDGSVHSNSCTYRYVIS